MVDEAKPRLGRGLAALLGDSSDGSRISDGIGGKGRRIPIDRLRVNPQNPRKSFPEGGLDDLAQSIRARGILQPILVRELPGSKDEYEIVAGERRWRAAQRAGLHEVPIVKVEATDGQALEIAIIENVQRSDLNPLEEAEGYQRLLEEFHYNHQQLGEVVGKSRSHVSNTLRLLKLPDQTKSLLFQGEISAGHARALLAVDNADEVANEIVGKGLSVRDAETLAAASSKNRTRVRSDGHAEDLHAKQIEKLLADNLGLTVSLRLKGEKGDLRIQFSNLEQLDLICNRLQSLNMAAGSG